MIAVNLLPKEERSEELKLGRPRLRFLAWVAGAVVVVVVVGGSQLVAEMKIQGLREDLMIAQQENSHLKSQAELVRQLDARQQQLESRLSLVFDLSRDRRRSLALVDQLAVRIPDHLWLTKVEQSGTTGQLIEGVTFSNLIVAELMSRLRDAEAYEAIDLAVAERGLIGEEPVVKFSLTTRVAN
ncbi:MAG: hypothetical protein GF330_14360 [Candidatus Eisenbacteria bacterium]|nr:hypothetical protein [Candidatus Eisenbacteria bacterium]